jgi:phospholipid transport system substrate-binding protein
MRLRILLFILAALMASAWARACPVDPARAEPHQLVQEVTDCLLADIERYRGKLEEAGSETRKRQLMEGFLSELRATLEPVVDFDWIALNVMGSYRRDASAGQRERFQEVFTESLVETYGRGLLSYSDQTIKVFPPEGDIGDRRRVTVTQEIRGPEKNYPLVYSMGKNRRGQWKVINVIINGINLGKTFRSQFVQAAEKNDGNLDAVIANWTTKTEIEETGKA